MVPCVTPPQGAPFSESACILVVQDEPLIRMMVGDELRDEGFHVIEAFNADEALELLGLVVPDLIISDVQMPGSLDGLGLLAKVRERLPTVPVIFTSGHFRPTGPIDNGPTLFVAKPYACQELVNAVKNQLTRVA